MFRLPKKGGGGGGGQQGQAAAAGEGTAAAAFEEKLCPVFALGSQDKRISGEQAGRGGSVIGAGEPAVQLCPCRASSCMRRGAEVSCAALMLTLCCSVGRVEVHAADGRQTLLQKPSDRLGVDARWNDDAGSLQRR